MALVYLDAERLNKYLPRDDTTQLSEAEANAEGGLEADYVSRVFSRLAKVYDTSGWLNAATTPKLVLTIIAMYVAGTIYNREAADQLTEFGNQRIAEAEMLLEGLVSNELELLDVTDDAVLRDEVTEQPSVEESDPTFTMDVVF